MPLPEKNNQIITLDKAGKFTRAFRQIASADAIISGLFWKEYVQKILDQPSCVAIRYYHGIDDDGKPTVILVGVDNNGNDLTGGVLTEYGWPCPPFCSSTNPLNS